MSELVARPAGSDIVATAGRYYRNARYLIVALAIGAGCWFAYDGYIGWPYYKATVEAMTTEKRALVVKPHDDFDILLQQRLAWTMFGAAPVLLVFFLYRSRGAYRLAGTTLYVPGHPPVPFDSIIGLDKTRWDRKGIAVVEYQLSASERPATLVLDDFIYQQTPTDEIVDRIEKYVRPGLVLTRPHGAGARDAEQKRIEDEQRDEQDTHESAE